MIAARRSFLWPLLILALGVVWLFVTTDAVPDAFADLLQRAWPALLVLIGLEALLGRRQLAIGARRLPASALIVLVVVVALGVIVALAYQKQADSVRAENVQTFEQPLGEDIRALEVTAQLERTAITVGPGEAGVQTIAARYAGSRGHTVTMEWGAEAQTGTLAVVETNGGSIPRLEDYGRATFELSLPDKTPITLLRVESEAGDAELDLRALQIQRLESALSDGSLVVTLPSGEALNGRLEVRGGNLELRVPAGIPMTVSLAEGSGEPSYIYDDLRYDLLRDGTLKLENATEFQIGLTVWLESGATLRVVDIE
jgi:hypothetical protein